MRVLSYFALLALATPTALVAQTVYKCTEADGSVVYSQRPCAADPAKVETIDTSAALKTGSGGSVDEQSNFARMNQIRRTCDERIKAVGQRYVTVYGQISQDEAALAARQSANDLRVNDVAYHAEIRKRLADLSAERAKFRAEEAKELETAQELCRTEVEAEEKRVSDAEAARVKAQAAADKAAASADAAGRNPGQN